MSGAIQARRRRRAIKRWSSLAPTRWQEAWGFSSTSWRKSSNMRSTTMGCWYRIRNQFPESWRISFIEAIMGHRFEPKSSHLKFKESAQNKFLRSLYSHSMLSPLRILRTLVPIESVWFFWKRTITVEMIFASVLLWKSCWLCREVADVLLSTAMQSFSRFIY